MNGLTSPFGWLPIEKERNRPAPSLRMSDSALGRATRVHHFIRLLRVERFAAWRQTPPVRLNSMTYKATDGSGRAHGDSAPKGDSQRRLEDASSTRLSSNSP